MALSQIIVFVLFLTSPLLASFPPDISGQMLYLLHRGEANKAFANYLEYSQLHKKHDFSLLQQAATYLLEHGIESDDLETQLMCMFGAGVSGTSDLLPLLEKGVRSSDQRIQLIALSYLAKQSDDEADELLLHALSSPFLLTRLEGCYQLAKKNHPSVLTHLQSLMVKVPDLVRSLFPQIVVHLEGRDAYHYLRQLLTDPNVEVRMEAILSVAKEGRDDFLPQIRALATQAHHAQQECCALALGELKDTQSIPLLNELLHCPRKEVRLAAALALYRLGESESVELIKKEADLGNLFAIHELGTLREGKEVLHKLLAHSDRDIRLNATLALLQQGEAGLPEEILLTGKSDFGFVRLSSPGLGMRAWRTIPSHHHHTKSHPGVVQQTLALREHVLTKALELPEPLFLNLAKKLIQENQIELIPLLATLLENRRSDSVIALLKEGQQLAGLPLVRNYFTLALYRLHEEGPYEELLINWAKRAGDQALIQFREDEASEALTSCHDLTPEETSRFLVETFETLARGRNQIGVDVLVHAIAYGNPKNRYALAGLLIRTTE